MASIPTWVIIGWAVTVIASLGFIEHRLTQIANQLGSLRADVLRR